MKDYELGVDVTLVIGPALQAGGAALLFVLFLLLGANAGRRPYFRLWTAAWLMLTIGLGLVAVCLTVAPEIVTTANRVAPVWLQYAFVAYFVCKCLFVLALVFGTLSYARGKPSVRVQRISVVALLAYALGAGLASHAAHHAMINQAPVVIAGSLLAAWLLFSMSPSRRTLGSRLTGSMFVVSAFIWIMYSLVFVQGFVPEHHDYPRLVAFLLGYNWFINVIVHMMTAIGMLLILMEDARREIDAAHDELAHAHRALQVESMRDALTGALNRRAFSIGTGLEHAKASFGAVIVLDLDNLKEVNDTNGHAAGDALLVHCVSVLRDGMRPTDKLYRWGGDEFLLILSRADPDEARARFCRLINEAPPVVTEAGVKLHLKASLGAAPYEGGTNLECAIHAADVDMYEAKRATKGTGET